MRVQLIIGVNCEYKEKQSRVTKQFLLHLDRK